MVHKQPLVEASSFFRAALSGSFQEAENHSVSLPEDDVDIVNHFIQWLCYGEVELPPHTHENRFEVPEMIASLYIFGDRYLVPHLGNDMVDLLYRCHQAQGLSGSFSIPFYIYSNTPGPCGMRKLLVDSFAYRDGWRDDFSTWAQRHPDEYHPEFALEVTEEFVYRIQFHEGDENHLVPLDDEELAAKYHDK